MIARKLVVLGFLVAGLFGLSMIPQQATAQGTPMQCVEACEAADQICQVPCDGNSLCIAKCAKTNVACQEACYRRE
jgi:hypothetical protein